MPEAITIKGQPLTLKGAFVREGQIAPDCELTGKDLKPVKLSSFKGKAFVLFSVPSLDTPTCNKETHRFNEEMAKYKDQLNVICVSMDLPFAQARWCGAEGIENVLTLSDYKNREFGQKYGVLINELGLLARAIFILDSNMKVLWCDLVKEVTSEPDYQKVLAQVNQLLVKK